VRTDEEAQRHDEAITALRRALGEEFEVAWLSGRELELAVAVDEALASRD